MRLLLLREGDRASDTPALVFLSVKCQAGWDPHHRTCLSWKVLLPPGLHLGGHALPAPLCQNLRGCSPPFLHEQVRGPSSSNPLVSPSILRISSPACALNSPLGDLLM